MANDFDCGVPRQHYSLGAIGWFIELVLSAPCSQRAAAKVVSWISRLWPGSVETPCANTGRNWLFRLGLYRFPPGVIDFIKYPCTVSDRRFRAATEFEPRWSLHDIFAHLRDERARAAA